MKKTLLFGLVSLLVLAGCSSKPSSSDSESAPTTSTAKTIEELTFAHSGALKTWIIQLHHTLMTMNILQFRRNIA